MKWFKVRKFSLSWKVLNQVVKMNENQGFNFIRLNENFQRKTFKLQDFCSTFQLWDFNIADLFSYAYTLSLSKLILKTRVGVAKEVTNIRVQQFTSKPIFLH